MPTWWERDSVILIAVAAVLFFFGSIGYFILKKKLKQRYLLAKVRLDNLMPRSSRRVLACSRRSRTHQRTVLCSRLLHSQAERRRSRKSSSEDNIGKASTGAFGHK